MNIAQEQYGLTPEQLCEVDNEFNKLVWDLENKNEQYSFEFCSAPAAKKHHQNYYGGLFEHCSKMARHLYAATINRRLEFSIEECAKIAFLHDFCKLFLYTDKGDGSYDYDPELYEHHAKRSVELAEELGYNLSQKEKVCILLHMGKYRKDEDDAIMTASDKSWAEKNAALVLAVQQSDMAACK